MSTQILTFNSSSPEETQCIGKKIAAMLKGGEVICLEGDLGAGKTTLVKGLAQGLVTIDPDEVTSPTFNYLNIYTPKSTAELALFHFDLYRLCDAEEFALMGFQDYLYAGGVCCIEWSQKIASYLPAEAWRLSLQYSEAEDKLDLQGDQIFKRRIVLSYPKQVEA